MKLLFLGGLLS